MRPLYLPIQDAFSLLEPAPITRENAFTVSVPGNRLQDYGSCMDLALRVNGGEKFFTNMAQAYYVQGSDKTCLVLGAQLQLTDKATIYRHADCAKFVPLKGAKVAAYVPGGLAADGQPIDCGMACNPFDAEISNPAQTVSGQRILVSSAACPAFSSERLLFGLPSIKMTYNNWFGFGFSAPQESKGITKCWPLLRGWFYFTGYPSGNRYPLFGRYGPNGYFGVYLNTNGYLSWDCYNPYNGIGLSGAVSMIQIPLNQWLYFWTDGPYYSSGYLYRMWMNGTQIYNTSHSNLGSYPGYPFGIGAILNTTNNAAYGLSATAMPTWYVADIVLEGKYEGGIGNGNIYDPNYTRAFVPNKLHTAPGLTRAA